MIPTRFFEVMLISFRCVLTVLFAMCFAAPASGGGSPISVDSKATYPLKFTGFWIPFDNNISSKLNSANIQEDIANELEKQGYNIADSKEGQRFKLGAMAKELNCVGRKERSCEIEIMWELWDFRMDAVIYRVRTRATELNIREDERIPGLRRLVIKALYSLMSRPRFVRALEKNPSDIEMESVERSLYGDATFLACNRAALRMPQDAKSALAATTLVKSGRSVGSGVSISPDGFILTAAHVLDDSSAKVVFQDGKEHDAVLIRKNRKRDVALLKMKGKGYPCLNFREDRGQIGEKIYAIGSPASEDLAFSLTTGIISAERQWNEDTYLQTDASINPGNSGGPLLDEEGNILAIVSWKLVGIGLEGIGFGIPVGVALKALSVAPGEASSAGLSRENVAAKSEGKSNDIAFEDTPDEKQNLLPEDEAPSRSHSRWKRPFKLTTRWSGVGLFTVGVALTTMSYVRIKVASGQDEDYYDHMTYHQYKGWITTNIVGWVLAPVGAALFITSFLVRSKDEWSTEARVRGDFFGNATALEIRF